MRQNSLPGPCLLSDVTVSRSALPRAVQGQGLVTEQPSDAVPVHTTARRPGVKTVGVTATRMQNHNAAGTTKNSSVSGAQKTEVANSTHTTSAPAAETQKPAKATRRKPVTDKLVKGSVTRLTAETKTESTALATETESPRSRIGRDKNKESKTDRESDSDSNEGRLQSTNGRVESDVSATSEAGQQQNQNQNQNENQIQEAQDGSQFRLDPTTLNPGDILVHNKLGVCRFKGTRVEVPEGKLKKVKYVVLQFADGSAKLSVKQAKQVLYRYTL